MKAGSMSSAIIIASISVVLIGGLMIYAGLFANASLIQTFDSTLNPAAASGTFNFNGSNTTTGEYANITVSGAVNCYYFNTTGAGKPIGCLVVNVNGVSPNFDNTSTGSANQLMRAINLDSTVNGSIVATNGTLNVTTITARITGVSGNSITLSDTSPVMTSVGMSGGVDGMSAYASTKTNVNSAFVILGVVLIFAGIGGLIATVFSMVGKTGVRQ